MDFLHDTGGGGRNRGHRLLIFQLQNGLVLGDSVAFLHENANDNAGIGALAQLGKFYVHKLNRQHARS